MCGAGVTGGAAPHPGQWLVPFGPYAFRNLSRNAFIGHTGASVAGLSPSVQPHEAIRSHLAAAGAHRG